MQRNKISFEGQKIFIGIDVHKRTWAVTTVTESGYCKTHSQNASAQELFDFLTKHYPKAHYYAVYETGFSGFSTYYALTELGINCTVIHAADVPTTQYENVMKTDKVDSVKLAKALRAGMLKGIYIFPKDNIDERGLIRARRSIVNSLSRYKVKIKHLLMTNGVKIPLIYDRPSHSTWSNNFIQWLKSDEIKLLSTSRKTLDLYISIIEQLRQQLLMATKQLRNLALSPKYRHHHDLLCSIPGVGTIIAMTLLTEIADFKRFSNSKQFVSYLGLIPTSHSSGENNNNGNITFRANTELRRMLIEASWITIKKDKALAADYLRLKKRMCAQMAIVRIARKLACIIRAVITEDKYYVPYS